MSIKKLFMSWVYPTRRRPVSQTASAFSGSVSRRKNKDSNLLLYFVPVMVCAIVLLFASSAFSWVVLAGISVAMDEAAALPRVVSVQSAPHYYFISTELAFENDFEELSVPESVDTSFKTYMDYRKITRTSSPQYGFRLLGETDDHGLRRFRGDYLVALGTYYGSIGDRFEITLSGGRVFFACMGDYKADIDTDASNRFIPANGNMVEFIIDINTLCPSVASGGNISPLGFEGSVVSIKKLP